MFADETTTQDSKGVWLWTVFSTVTLFLVEFILFAAFIPTHWADTVSATEKRWLVQAQGQESAEAVIARAQGWYRSVFIDTGIEPWTYNVFAPGSDVKVEKGFEPLASSPIWDWTRGRLDVIWGSFAQAFQRIALVLAWLPFLFMLIAAGAGDGWVRRRIRQYAFAYASPLAHHSAMVAILLLWIGFALLLLAPVPLPGLAVPWLFILSAVCVDIAVTHTQKRL